MSEEYIKTENQWSFYHEWQSDQHQRNMNDNNRSNHSDTGLHSFPHQPRSSSQSDQPHRGQPFSSDGQRMFPRLAHPIMSLQTFTHILADSLATAIRYNSPHQRPGRQIFTDRVFEYDVVWGVSSVRRVPDLRLLMPLPGTVRPANVMTTQTSMQSIYSSLQQSDHILHPQPRHILRSMEPEFVLPEPPKYISSFNSDETLVSGSPQMTTLNTSLSSSSSGLWMSESNAESLNSSYTESSPEGDTRPVKKRSFTIIDEEQADNEASDVTPKKAKTGHDVPPSRRSKGFRNKNEEYYRSHGAVAKPSNGKKREGERCLTCIKYDRACRGNVIKNGNCDTCCAVRNARNQKRSCLWADPDEGIWTYEAAQQATGSRKILSNTTEALSERGKGTLFQQAKAEVNRAVQEVKKSKDIIPNSDAWRLVNGLTEQEGDAPDLFLSVLEYPEGSLKREAMYDIVFSCLNAIQSLDAEDDILNALLNAAEAHVTKLTTPSDQSIEELAELALMAKHYEAIIQRMRFMKRVGRKIRKEKVEAFLGDDVEEQEEEE